ncbi:MAG: carboxylating nicotinate-nucleotide diphosphorylase [Acidobacteria bacterium]|nr:MAG: carboxylating nicotinate-nucleotide diphosphorylase [Acidobacteriota bacterium]
MDAAEYRDIVRRALDEDIGGGDLTTEATVGADQRARGVFLVKAECMLAGLDVALEAFRLLDPDVRATMCKHDGDRCEPGQEIASIVGSARALLTGERTALNLLQRLSGVATRARRFVDAAAGRITILDTRKTTPGLRLLEKYAVRAGGATNHRIGLYDAVLIKENHIHLAGGVRAALARVRAANARVPIEIEAETLDEVDEALAAGAGFILLDNMSTADIREAVRRTAGRAKIEISGGVTLERIPELAETGADYVSVGALTHSAPAVDISFEIEPL